MIRHPLSQSCLATHSCPESKTKFTELFKRSVNRYLVHFGLFLLLNCKARNPEQKEIKVVKFYEVTLLVDNLLTDLLNNLEN